MSVGFNCGCSCAPAPCTVSRTFTVTGACGPTPGATVAVTKSGGSTATVTTNSSGVVTVTGLTSGSYTFTASFGTRYATASGSFTVASNCVPSTGSIPTVTLSPAAGYHCLCFCSTPVADTLHLTDPVAGAVTLTYNPSSGFWEGAKSGTWTSKYPAGGTAGCVCNTPTYDLTWKLNYSDATHGCSLFVSGTIDLKLWTDRSNNGVLTCDQFGSTFEGRFAGTGVSDVVSCSSTPVLTITIPGTSGGGEFYNDASNSAQTFTITE
jgi:hypothetical protein